MALPVKNYYEINREILFDEDHRHAFEKCIGYYGGQADTHTKGEEDNQQQQEEEEDGESLSLEEIDLEIARLEAAIASQQQHRLALQDQRATLAHDLHTSQSLSDALLASVNVIEGEGQDLLDDLLTLQAETSSLEGKLEKYLQINDLNDFFYIWYAGPYGTINSFRLGNMAIKPIDSSEINAALGQAALLVSILAEQFSMTFKSYEILPMSSFTRIVKLESSGRKTIYPLHLEAAGFTLYPKWNFNQGLIGFLTCLWELGEMTSEMDPTLSMPYKIVLAEEKIGEVSFVYGQDDVTWTKAMKFMLSNIKWLVAWATKHGESHNFQASSSYSTYPNNSRSAKQEQL